MRVFLTGATGFIGAALLGRLLALGHQVTALARDPRTATATPGTRFVAGDLRDPAGLEQARPALGQADAVAHLAAVRRDWGMSDPELRRVNVESGPRLLAMAEAASRFLFVSSVAVYGHPEGGPAREASPFRPSKRYGVSKVEAEAEMRAAAVGRPAALVIARPGIVYGPGDTYGMVANLTRLVARGRFLMVGPGSNRVNLLFIDDLAEALARCLLSPQAAGEDFILSGPEAVPVQSLASAVAQSLGTRLWRLRVPAALARVTASAMEGLWRRTGRPGEPFLTRAKVDLLTREDLYDTDKAARRLGFAPGVRLAEGLPGTVAWLRESGNL